MGELEVLQDRLERLETRLLFQEETLESLNRVVADQQLEIVELNRRLEKALEQIRSLTPSNIADLSEETPPPHY